MPTGCDLTWVFRLAHILLQRGLSPNTPSNSLVCVSGFSLSDFALYLTLTVMEPVVGTKNLHGSRRLGCVSTPWRTSVGSSAPTSVQDNASPDVAPKTYKLDLRDDLVQEGVLCTMRNHCLKHSLCNTVWSTAKSSRHGNTTTNNANASQAA